MKKKDTHIIQAIWKDRQLLLSLSLQDFKQRFSGTYFGIFWALTQPLLTILVYWYAFQYGFKSGDVSGVPYAVWFICGIVPWLFVSEAFSSASNSFIEYSYLIKKVKFNVNILPLVKILSSFLIHVFFCMFAIAVAAFFRILPSIYMIQLPYYMVCCLAILFSISLLTASIMVFFRDLNQFISVLLLIGMWGSPIAWSLEGFSGRVQYIFKLNPFFYIIEGYRDAILGRKWFFEKPVLTLYFFLITGIFFALGSLVYLRMRPHFADTV